MVHLGFAREDLNAKNVCWNISSTKDIPFLMQVLNFSMYLLKKENE